MPTFNGYYRGQGKLFLASRTAGVAQGYRWLGDGIDFKYGATVDKETIEEAYSGQSATAAELTKGNKGTWSFVMRKWSRANIALALRGTAAAVAGSTASAEALPTVAVGDIVFSKYADISSLVVTDSAGSPATLTLNTDYRINNAKTGEIEILGLAAYTQPFKLAYTYAAQESIVLLNAADTEFSLMYAGVNTVENSTPVRLELYKCKSDALKEMLLITNTFGTLPIEGAMMIDPYRSSGDALGQFGRFLIAAP